MSTNGNDKKRILTGYYFCVGFWAEVGALLLYMIFHVFREISGIYIMVISTLWWYHQRNTEKVVMKDPIAAFELLFSTMVQERPYFCSKLTSTSWVKIHQQNRSNWFSDLWHLWIRKGSWSLTGHHWLTGWIDESCSWVGCHCQEAKQNKSGEKVMHFALSIYWSSWLHCQICCWVHWCYGDINLVWPFVWCGDFCNVIVFHNHPVYRTDEACNDWTIIHWKGGKHSFQKSTLLKW